MRLHCMLFGWLCRRTRYLSVAAGHCFTAARYGFTEAGVGFQRHQRVLLSVCPSMGRQCRSARPGNIPHRRHPSTSWQRHSAQPWDVPPGKCPSTSKRRCPARLQDTPWNRRPCTSWRRSPARPPDAPLGKGPGTEQQHDFAWLLCPSFSLVHLFQCLRLPLLLLVPSPCCQPQLAAPTVSPLLFRSCSVFNCLNKSTKSLQGFFTLMAASSPREASSVINLPTHSHVFKSRAVPSVIYSLCFLDHVSRASKVCSLYLIPCFFKEIIP